MPLSDNGIKVTLESSRDHHALLCPSCGYQLHGGTAERCSECGTRLVYKVYTRNCLGQEARYLGFLLVSAFIVSLISATSTWTTALGLSKQRDSVRDFAAQVQQLAKEPSSANSQPNIVTDADAKPKNIWTRLSIRERWIVAALMGSAVACVISLFLIIYLGGTQSPLWLKPPLITLIILAFLGYIVVSADAIAYTMRFVMR